ncbi:MAG TPA: nuclear transport factor 2 family protein [Herpetosiphonaceae bacterium]|nr:nuclear transport factor 2 family protein [Herpetosiphonaceae bacterium]
MAAIPAPADANAAATMEVITRYLTAIEQGATGAALARFYDPEVIQEEFPNRLMANGARRDLAEILAGAERGQKVLTSQRYEVLNALVQGDEVALEMQWTGILAVGLGTLAAGDAMRARISSFITLRDGKIISQRSYDCFEPW